MPLFSPSWLLWLQTTPASAGGGQPPSMPVWLLWFYVWGEPQYTIDGPLGGPLTWLKVVGLFCVLGWLSSWVLASLKEAGPARLGWFDYTAIGGLVGLLAALLLQALQNTGRMAVVGLGGISVVAVLGLAATVILVAWMEVKVWSSVARRGTRSDLITLGLMHVGLLLGFAISFILRAEAMAQLSTIQMPELARTQLQPSFAETLVTGGRLGATYMGLVVLARIAMLLIPEFFALRFRRLYSVAWQCWVESFRRMWAPWVVIVVFGVILAFTSWFLQPPRPAEMGRLYVGTLMLLCSLLMTVMVTILAPISLPNDIRQQTIFTVVSKPVRRLELIWGRMLGYMALVTVLLLLFGGISLIYFHRMIGGEIRATQALADQYARENKEELARKYRDQADQLSTRMSAREPLRGSLSFIDSRGNARTRGIDVGLEMEFRSFVEGASQSKAIWDWGPAVPDPRDRTRPIDRRVPVDQLLEPNTIEWYQNRIAELQDASAEAEMARRVAQQAKQSSQLTTDMARNQSEIRRLEQLLASAQRDERTLRSQGKTREADAKHSPPVRLEMTFMVYRTTKGELGEPVYASLKAINPRPGSTPFNDFFPVREYYTTKRTLPSKILVGSHGNLRIEVGCGTPNQYLGMAESDLYILGGKGGFDMNYMRGLVGVWLQAMVLTAIGVCAGTFLSWPVALLMTIWFFIAGQVGFGFLQQFAVQGLVGGGPFESLIRLLSHDNQMSELDPTLAVVVAKTFDAVVMPVMSRLVYLVPNFSAMDVSNTVSSGFAVTFKQLASNTLLALGYALPFSIAGYFILRNREVAA